MLLVLLFFIFSYVFTCTIGIGFDNNNALFLFKNRDKRIECNDSISGPVRTNTLYLDDNLISNDFLSITTSETKNVYFGTNSSNLAIANAYVSIDEEVPSRYNDNENSIYSNASLIKETLMMCGSLDCFESILNNLTSFENDSQKVSSNFAVFDSSNNAAIYEVYADIDTIIWVKFELDTNKFIFRTNHFLSDSLISYNPVHDSSNSSDSRNRYDTFSSKIYNIIDQDNFNAIDLISLENYFTEDDSLPFLRTLSKDQIPFSGQLDQYQEIDRPYGYFYNEKAISRARTVSSGLIINQDSSDNVMWANIGNPIISPYFPFKLSSFINSDGEYQGGSFPELLRDEDGISSFSQKTNELRKKLYNYNSPSCTYNQFIDSYMVDTVLSVIYNIEKDLYEDNTIDIDVFVSNAYDSLCGFYNNYDSYKEFSCDIVLKKIENDNGNYYFKIIDSSLHSPDSCSWLISDIDTEDLYQVNCTDSLINPQYDLTISKNLRIEHSVSYIEDPDGIIYQCNDLITLRGDSNQDASIDIHDVLLLVNIALISNLEDVLVNYYNVVNTNLDQIDVNIHDIVELVEIILNE